MFKIVKQHKKSKARIGQLKTRRGVVNTPCFMPIATRGVLKTLTTEDLNQLGAQIILGNTYHLMLRPGEKEMKKHGGLHNFMKWDGAILTDSGGFQVFSLSKIRKLTGEGVEFRSHVDGAKYFLTPESSIRIQRAIDSDIIMVLDECVGLPAKREYLEQSVELTSAWAKRSFDYFRKTLSSDRVKSMAKLEKRPLVFGIIQGGLERDLREKSAADLTKIPFDGFAIGGLAVGESVEEMQGVLDYVDDLLPKNKPRYLMGVGRPEQIVAAVLAGVDMFDCVIPTREARHGRLFMFKKRASVLNGKKFYEQLTISNKKFKFDKTPINADSKFEILRKYSRAYLRYLFMIEEPLGQRLATLNNLEFYLGVMDRLRGALSE
jgi:queuine tRNA-ribosyltransferase